MSIETRMTIAQSTPMPHRSEDGVTVRYEAKVFSLWDRKASAEVAHACERREADSIQLKKLLSIHRRRGPVGTEEKASD
jgi:hypothetical protein